VVVGEQQIFISGQPSMLFFGRTYVNTLNKLKYDILL
jgi:hypothetical protein